MLSTIRSIQSALFHADLIRTSLQVPDTPAPPGAQALERSLRLVIADTVGLELRTVHPSRLDLRLARFHGDFIARRGAMIHKNWLPLCRSVGKERQSKCQACGARAYSRDYFSSVYRGYRRRLVFCSREGLVEDSSLTLKPAAIRVSAIAGARGDVINAHFFSTEPLRACWISVGLEKHGVEGISSRPRRSEAIRTDSCFKLEAERKLSPGLFFVCMVLVADHDYSYQRMPLVI